MKRRSNPAEMNLFDDQIWLGRRAELTKPQAHLGTFRVGDSVVDSRTGMVHSPGQTRRLRRKELDLLAYLHGCGTPVGRNQLLRDVWNCSNMVTRTVDQTVATLRRKLNDNTTKPKYLITVYGVGYQLRTEQSRVRE
jgi:DNA-binding response OmpR family regulator